MKPVCLIVLAIPAIIGGASSPSEPSSGSQPSVTSLVSRIPYHRLPVIVCDPAGCLWFNIESELLPIPESGVIVLVRPARLAASGLDWTGCSAARLPFIVFSDAMAEYAEAARLSLEAKRMAHAIMGPDLVIPHHYTELGQRWKKVIEPLMKKGFNTDADLTVIEKYLRDLRAAVDRRNAFRNRRTPGK